MFVLQGYEGGLADHSLCEVVEFAWVLQHRLRASEENE